MSRLRTAAVVGVATTGLAALSVAALLAVVPDAVVERLPAVAVIAERVERVGGRTAVGVVGGTLVTLAWRFLGAGGAFSPDDRLDGPTTRLPERVDTDPTTIAGDGLDRAFDRTPVSEIGDRLRSRVVAVERLAGADEATACERVSAGNWTEDRLAASVVSSELSVPVSARLRAWLDPDTERRRRLRRTLDALDARLASVRTADAGHTTAETEATTADPADTRGESGD